MYDECNIRITPAIYACVLEMLWGHCASLTHAVDYFSFISLIYPRASTECSMFVLRRRLFFSLYIGVHVYFLYLLFAAYYYYAILYRKAHFYYFLLLKIQTHCTTSPPPSQYSTS